MGILATGARVCACTLLYACGSASTALAQTVFSEIDPNGVDVARGAFTHSSTDVAIGSPSMGGLSFTRLYRSTSNTTGFWTHGHIGYVYTNGNTCVVTIGMSTETFSGACNGLPSPNQQMGSMLSGNASAGYTYTLRDGTVAYFAPTYSGQFVIQHMPSSLNGYLIKITTPEGVETTYDYQYGPPVCSPSPQYCYFQIVTGRLSGVNSNLGYRLALEYAGGPQDPRMPHTVKAINTSIEYCTGANCSQSWPTAQYTLHPSGAFNTVTNSLGHQTTYTYSGTALTEIQSPHDSNHDVSIFYTSNRVSAIDLGFGTWTYSYLDSGADRTATVINPDTTYLSYTTSIATGRLKSVTNESNETTSFQYDSAARTTRIIQPLGNYVQFTLDSRGNVIETRHVASGHSDIVSTASFVTPCTNQKTCNQPTSTTDHRGYRTDYTYSSTHGGLMSVTMPAPSGPSPVGSGNRPQTRLSYSQFQAKYKTANSGSGYVSGSAVWRATGLAACATGVAPGCVGTADEVAQTLGYQSSSIANNVLPSQVTRASGSGSVVATTAVTFTPWGDLQIVDGPLTGSADTTRFYYDAGRRLVGIVGPDPDGGGPALPRAMRTYYNTVGAPTSIERGTATNQGDSALSTFLSIESQDIEYDQYARPIRMRMWDGASVLTLTQTNYDARGRRSCTVVRMNPAYFSSVIDACATSPSGTYGADRITRLFYDPVGRVSSIQSAYGTALQQTSAIYTYTANGNLSSLTNARGYLTGYTYDGHGRLVRLNYPNPSVQGQWSSTDFEQFDYDIYGILEQERRRSGDVFGFTFDNLSRLTNRDAPASQPDSSYEYDLFGRTIQEAVPGNTLTTTYDALSRVTSVSSSVLGAVSYGYDSGSRRTRLDYPDGYYLTYAYNNASDLTELYENGTIALASYQYDAIGRRVTVNRGNGVTTSNSYDAVSRLASLAHDAAGSVLDVAFAITYNPSNQIVSRTRNNSAYDWILPSGYNQTYDADGLNRYTSALGVAPTYDSRGNLQSDGTKTFSYDFDNRLVSASGGASLGYDARGRLHETNGGTTTRFLYDGTDLIAEYNSSGGVVRRYAHGPGTDEPTVWYDGATTSNRRWLLSDERGSIIATTDGSGATTQVNSYDAYGVPSPANQGRFQYTGQMWIPEIGMYHYKARAYHPQLGRFAQTDPIGYSGGLNLYEYVGSDPVNYIDPTGMGRICYLQEFADQHENFGLGIRVIGTPDVWRCVDYPSISPSLAGGPSGVAGGGGGGGNGTTPSPPEKCLVPTSNASTTIPFPLPLGGATTSGSASWMAALRMASVLTAPLALTGDTANRNQAVIRGGLASPENLMTGSTNVPGTNISGFSVTTAPGMTATQLAMVANYPNTMISVTSTMRLMDVGVRLVPTPSATNPLHATAVVPVPLDPARAAAISAVFTRVPNPACGGK